MADFATGETGFHTNPGIVTRDGMTAQKEQGLGSPSGQKTASGFGRRHGVGFSGQAGEQPPERRFIQMMEKQVRDDGVHRWTLLDPSGPIGRDHGRQPVSTAKMDEGGFGNHGLAIDKKDPGAVPAFRIRAQENRAEKGSISRPKIRQGGGRTSGIIFLKPARPETDLAEDRVKALEIPAAGAGSRVVG